MKKDAEGKSKSRVTAVLTTIVGAIAGHFTASTALYRSRKEQYRLAQPVVQQVQDALSDNLNDHAAARSQIESLVAPSVQPAVDSFFEAAAKGESTVSQSVRLGSAIMDSQPTWVSRVPGGSKTVYATAVVAGSALAYGAYKAIKGRKNSADQEDEPTGKHTAALKQERTEQAATAEKSASR